MNNINSKIIFDIGAHKGDDTHIYLQLGYKVIAVEANPKLIEIMQKRFANYIKTGQLVLHQAVIYKSDNEKLPFYIERDSSKSSIEKPRTFIEIINVSTIQLKSLLTKYGVPYYCKIDIEKSDYFALESLDTAELPANISVEISGESIGYLAIHRDTLFKTFNQLKVLGYTAFKLVDQETLAVLDFDSFYYQKKQLSERLKVKFFKFFNLDYRSQFLKNFELPKDSEVSGAVPERLSGRWYTAEEIEEIIAFHFHEYQTMTSQRDLIFWVDLYAKL